MPLQKLYSYWFTANYLQHCRYVILRCLLSRFRSSLPRQRMLRGQLIGIPATLPPHHLWKMTVSHTTSAVLSGCPANDSDSLPHLTQKSVRHTFWREHRKHVFLTSAERRLKICDTSQVDPFWTDAGQWKRSFIVLTIADSWEVTLSGKYHKPSGMQKHWSLASNECNKVLKQAWKVRETSQFSPVIQTLQQLRLDKHRHATYSNAHYLASHFTLKALFHTNNLPMTEKPCTMYPLLIWL